ncbi:uncharacterized protein LOC128264871 [Drosophila gunungcola]|uniref:uncharacterized protein LOC128264871 n=1 Tax=Drosophila gunungcola TaxID=103775 RepID=UPI0022E37F48|nr:uncharacterized protein LOC128264871 [Drosophila gunungcola]
MDKTQIGEWLQANEIEFPASATLRQLRKLALDAGYQEVAEIPESILEEENSKMEVLSQGAATEGIQTLEEEEALLDAAIRVAEKKKILAGLMKNVDKTTDDLQMVKHLVSPFSATEKEEALKWILNFERVCRDINTCTNFQLRCVRMLMKSGTDADLFVSVDRSNTYDEFKTNFIKTFGRGSSTADIVLLLKETMFNPAKNTVMGYILLMEEIAMRANIDEKLTVQFVIDGFRDRSANNAILYTATTIAQLKELAWKYGNLRKKSHNFPQRMENTGGDRKTVRCYNCSAYGHYASSCTAPKREKGSCFRCGSLQHMLKDCQQKPASDPRVVGAANNQPIRDDEEEPNMFIPIFNQRH